MKSRAILLLLAIGVGMITTFGLATAYPALPLVVLAFLFIAAAILGRN